LKIALILIENLPKQDSQLAKFELTNYHYFHTHRGKTGLTSFVFIDIVG